MERAKYRLQIGLLADRRYRDGLELGCSNGVLTEMLAPLCDRLLAVDHVEPAVVVAQDRLRSYGNVRVERATLPQAFPEGKFDLVVFAELGYYFGMQDLKAMHEAILRSLLPSGRVIVTHHAITFSETYRGHAMPSTCDDIHSRFERDSRLRHLTRLRANDAEGAITSLHGAELYRIDLFERVGDSTS